jgi:hypothetical protein
MSRYDDGVEIDLPFFRVYAGSRGVRIKLLDDEGVIDMEWDDSAEYREVRRSVRSRLRFVRHLFIYLALNSLFVVIDWQTGGPGNGISWSIWVAAIWGAILGWEFVSIFIAPWLWGRDMEKRLIQRELRRRQDG